MAQDLTSFLKSTGQLRENLKLKAETEFQKIIKEWVEERQEVATQVLKEERNYSTGALANSIIPRFIQEGDTGLLVEVLANDYWKFIDKGVNGVFKSQSSPYSFKNLGVGRNMQRSFKDFIKNRGIRELRYRNSEGNTVVKPLRNARDFDSAAYVLARSVKKKGIEGNEFMQIAFSEEAIQDLTERLETTVTVIFS